MKVIRGLGLLVCAAFFVSCATTGGQASFRPRGEDAAMKVDAQYNEMSGTLTLLIDGNEVLRKSLSWFGSTAEASAEYRGHKVNAELVKAMSFFGSKVKCTVTIDNEIAGKWEW